MDTTYTYDTYLTNLIDLQDKLNQYYRDKAKEIKDASAPKSKGQHKDRSVSSIDCSDYSKKFNTCFKNFDNFHDRMWEHRTNKSIEEWTPQMRTQSIESFSTEMEQLKAEYQPIKTETLAVQNSLKQQIFEKFTAIQPAIKLLNEFTYLGALKHDIRINKKSKSRLPIEGLPVVRPSILTMAATAAYYDHKYHIDIKLTGKDLKPCISEACKAHDGDFQFGALVDENYDRDKTIDSHFAPVVVARRSKQITLVVLDSACSESQYHIKGPDGCRVIYVESDSTSPRQSDSHSCRTEGLLILKHALRYDDFIASFEASSEITTHDTTDWLKRHYVHLKNCTIEHGSLPDFLSKTVQSNQKIKNMATVFLEKNIRPDTNKKEKKSLKSHYEKYTHKRVMIKISSEKVWSGYSEFRTKIESKVWDENFYTQAKGFSLIQKAYSELIDENKTIDFEKRQQIEKKYIK